MPLTLRPTIRPRERILAFGPAGVGKSTAALQIAQAVPDVTVWAIDNDTTPTYERLQALEYADVGNLMVRETEPSEWEEMLEAVAWASATATEDDWLVVDSISPTWPAVQSWFTAKTFGQDMDEYFLEVRQAKENARNVAAKLAETRGGNTVKVSGDKALGAFDGWVDWPVINTQYAKLYKAVRQFPGHVYVTAELSKFGDNDAVDREMNGLLGDFKVKPTGQKRLAHVHATVLLVGENRRDGHWLTTVKDRGRERMEEEPWEDFAKDYLVKIAGWKRAVVGAGAAS